jgi:hypothetical protein
MDAVAAYGTPLVEDPDRIGPVTALGLDETLFARTGRWRRQRWCTSIVDVGRPAQLLDVVAGRTAAGPSAWLEARPQAWRDGVAWGVLDLSGPYRKTFTDVPPVIEEEFGVEPAAVWRRWRWSLWGTQLRLGRCR